LYQPSKDRSRQQQLIDEQSMSIAASKAHPATHAPPPAVEAAEQLTLDALDLDVYPVMRFCYAAMECPGRTDAVAHEMVVSVQ
jgi:hypothetical protein